MFPPLKGGGGPQNVLPCLEGDAKSFENWEKNQMFQSAKV